jgi:predicted MarR family transcription regulator
MVRRWFQKLFGWPCDHQWELLKSGDGAKTLINYDNTTARQAFHYWIHRCAKCGESKQITGPKP